MPTVFYHSRRVNFKEWDNYSLKHFGTIEEAQAWAKECAASSRCFTLVHISPSDVDRIPRHLVLKQENGKYLNTLYVKDEDKLYGEQIVVPVKESWGLSKDQLVAGYSSNGSLFSVAATAPTYIDVFVPGWESVAYVLLNGCDRPMPVDRELCNSLLALKPGVIPEFPKLKRLNQLKYPLWGTLVTKDMKRELASLEAAKEAFSEEARKKRDEAFRDWYSLVIDKLAP